MSISRWALIAAVACLAGAASAGAQPASTPSDTGVTALLQALDRAITSGNSTAYLALLSPSADRTAAASFADENLGKSPAHAVLRERDRRRLESGDGYRLTLEVLFERGNRGRLATWQIDARPGPDNAGWRIESQRQLSALDNLYRLSLDTRREFAAHDLTITAEDLQITLSSGSVFVADTEQGTTAMVLLGKGEVVFSPSPASERGQIRLVSGADALRTPFDACFVRTNPGEFRSHLARLPAEEPVKPGDLRRAEQVFADDAPRSFTIDVGDLGTAPWSILPSAGDFLAEIHTRHYGTLTYARSPHEPEAIACFDRAHRHYLARYSSKEQISARGPFYSDDDRAEYVVQHYDVDAAFAPDRQWIEGRTTMLVRVRAPTLQTFQVRLADTLVVRSVVADLFGRLLAVRVRDQNTVMVTLPDAALRGSLIKLTVAYAGQLAPQSTTGPEALAIEAQGGQTMAPAVPIAPSYLYSARTPWYAQSPTPGHATATLRLTVPQPYACVASGVLVSSEPVTEAPQGSAARRFVFEARLPIRYLACLISDLVLAQRQTVRLPGTAAAREAPPQSPTRPAVTVADGNDPAPPPSPVRSLELTVDGNPSEQARARRVATDADDIVRFYTSLVGGCPYPNLTVAVIENQLPGGQSPAYLAVLDEQVPMSRLMWRDDPASFPGFPEFFTAHEIAHQWWGQAVGEKNYHDMWLSEGMAQYFAALFAEHAHGQAAFLAMMREMQRWTLRDSEDGPVSLGPRVGQLTNDARAFRAIVYDKAAVVLHMLRELVGDRAFFDGIRLFFERWRFRTAGSDDLRQAFEEASGKPLSNFFDRWVYNDTLPRLGFSWRVAHESGKEVLALRFEQAGDVFDLPMRVRVAYADGTSAEIMVPIDEKVVERRLPVTVAVRSVTANSDGLVPAVIVRR